MSGKVIERKEDLISHLIDQVEKSARNYGVNLEKKSYEDRFAELIQKLSSRNGVAILIDEYDKPILDNISRPEARGAFKDILAGFYGVIKPLDAHVRFALMTGVTKFSKVSVFSMLNNLDDLTMHSRYSDMLGYTEHELDTFFSDRLAALAEHEACTHDELHHEIRRWYNGYRFSDRDDSVYNPVSTMLLLERKKFSNYWFETGTPTFLLDVIQTLDYDVRETETMEVEEFAFSTFDVENLNVEPLLFQTGYLTIKDYDRKTMLYTLGYPNFEVKNAFLQYLVDRFSSVSRILAASHLHQMIKALRENDLEAFFTTLRAFFAGIDYDLQIENEKYYQTIFYLVFTLIGLRTQAEVKTNKGRADVVIETEQSVYIFEFKLYDSKEDAIQQIKDSQYSQKYQNGGKAIHLVGVEFRDRNIGDWVSEAL
jgi:hypothetical protein